ARARAERYLAARGKADVEPSYFERQENAITFNFATRQNGVVMYPDLIKVTVALDNGQVIGLEQRGFLMQHHRRTDLQPRITVDDARKKLSPNLTVTGSRLAVIPTDGGREVLTWEFRGKSGPNDYLVYIDAKNGAEVKILQLVDVREGILTM
ncbi:PepSY1/2 domain-containing protein, partial [Desulforudis sp. 1190]